MLRSIALLLALLCLSTASFAGPGGGGKRCDYNGAWSTSDFVESSGGLIGDAKGIAANRHAVIVSGTIDVAANEQRWLVRRSLDNGATWTTVDEFRFADGATWKTVDDNLDFQNGAGDAIAVDGDGRVYAAGHSNAERKMIVRRSTNGGATWSNVDQVTDMVPQAIAASSGGRVFVVGISGDATWSWFVRSSANGSSGWKNVDVFNYQEGKNAVARGVAIRSDGTVAVVGWGSSNEGGGLATHWLTRVASTSNPNDWTTVDDYGGTAELPIARGGGVAFGRGSLDRQRSRWS